MNKTQAVLNHLQTQKGITSLEAYNLYGATRLSAIIFVLKERGYNIIGRDEECIDHYGNVARYKRYFLV